MNTQKRFWLVLAVVILGMAIIACSCNGLTSILSTPTVQVIPPKPQDTVIPSTNNSTYASLPYYDDFSNANSGWDVYSSDHVDEGYRDGYYFLSSLTTEYMEDAYANKLFKDTVIEVDATPVKGIGQKSFDYGLSCRVQPNYDGYDFLITTDGYFAVYLVTDGGNTSTSLLQGDEYQASPAINQGYNTNHLKITCSGDQLIFEVNGVTLFSGNDSSYTDGDIRFTTQIYESTPNEIHYDNFAATTP